jgi:predicted nucleic acid-binding protein
MTGKTFVDANVLIYAHDVDAKGTRSQKTRQCPCSLPIACVKLKAEVLEITVPVQ